MVIRRPRNSKFAVVLRLNAVVVISVMGLSACVSGSNEGKSHQGSSTPNHSSSHRPSAASPGPLPPEKAAQTRYLSTDTPMRIDLLSLQRTTSKLMRLRLRLTNISSKDANLATTFQFHSTAGDNDYIDVALIDGVNMKAYYPARRADGSLLNTNLLPDGTLAPGKSVASSIFYPRLPAGTEKVDIDTIRSAPFVDVPVSRRPGPRRPGDPVAANISLDKPRILPLTGTADDLDGDKYTDDHGKSIDIRLSSDVLFALNKANLTKKAKGIGRPG